MEVTNMENIMGKEETEKIGLESERLLYRPWRDEDKDMSVAYKGYTNANGSTAHMSLVFNIFVIYTLFNQINARVLDDSFNSWIFPINCRNVFIHS